MTSLNFQCLSVKTASTSNSATTASTTTSDSISEYCDGNGLTCLFGCSHELDVEEVQQLTAEEAWNQLGLQVNPQPQ